MHDTPNALLAIGWVRERFGIDDEDELRTLLADPDQMLALLDVAEETERELGAKSPVAHQA
jgi:hypothetical protein